MQLRRGFTVGFAVSCALGLAAVAAPASAAGSTTRITVWIDCEGCQIRAVNAKDYYRSNGMNPVFYKVASVRNGKAVLRVPTAKTRAMAFEVIDMHYDLRGSLPAVALKRKGNKGSWCWAGTRKSTATMRFSTKRWIDYDTPEAAPGHYNMAVWAAPSVRTWRDSVNMRRLNSGGLGTQNQPACESR